MATTPNIGLYKPTRDDYVSVQRDLSNNYELIDGAIGQNNILINDMDIIVNGSTASVNVTAGQFVTVRNSTITGITDGIYKAKNNVASGTVFSSSNLESITDGALNAINNKFINGIIAKGSPYTFTVSPIGGGATGVVLVPVANIPALPTGYAFLNWEVIGNTSNTPLLFVAENPTNVYVYCFSGGTGGYTATIRRVGYKT